MSVSLQVFQPHFPHKPSYLSSPNSALAENLILLNLSNLKGSEKYINMQNHSVSGHLGLIIAVSTLCTFTFNFCSSVVSETTLHLCETTATLITSRVLSFSFFFKENQARGRSTRLFISVLNWRKSRARPSTSFTFYSRKILHILAAYLKYVLPCQVSSLCTTDHKQRSCRRNTVALL